MIDTIQSIAIIAIAFGLILNWLVVQRLIQHQKEIEQLLHRLIEGLEHGAEASHKREQEETKQC